MSEVELMNTMPDYEKLKESAARRSLEFISPGMKLGLGSGSTMKHLVRLLGEQVADGLQVKGAPTSELTAQWMREHGVPVISLEDHPRLDLTIDGADEVDPNKQLIKGGGGALLREKIVAWCSDRVVIIVDDRKLVDELGAFPLPVEVIPFAKEPIRNRLAQLGGVPTLRTLKDDTPFLTDEGNFIFDCRFKAIPHPQALARDLSATPGVVEHGLFIDMADVIVAASEDEVRIIE